MSPFHYFLLLIFIILFKGNGDQVRCFHCDGGLRLWDPSDEPWMEHARWFNTCGYVTLVKGEQFVKQAIVQNTSASLHTTVVHFTLRINLVTLIVARVSDVIFLVICFRV